MGRLDGKVALITGGASGMGMVASRLFASEGAKVLLTDVADEAGEAVAKEIESSGRRGRVRPRRRLERGRREAHGGHRRGAVRRTCTCSTTTPA